MGLWEEAVILGNHMRHNTSLCSFFSYVTLAAAHHELHGLGLKPLFLLDLHRLEIERGWGR